MGAIQDEKTPSAVNENNAASSETSLETSEAYENNPFLDPGLLEHWINKYEDSKYECRHSLTQK